jgi:rhamnosyltransferase
VLLNPTGSTTAALEFDFSALDSDIPLECRLFCILDRGLHDLSAAGIRKLASGRAKVLYFRLNDPSESPDEIAYNLQSFDLRRDFSAAQQDAFVASRIEEALELLLQRYDPALASVATLPESAAIVRPALLATAPLPPAAALTFVIPTLNGGAEFESTLRSIRAQRIYAASPLLVVDSGSTDGTVELAKKYGAVVHSIHSTQFNHGATRDFIIGKTTTPLVALLVQDATLMDSETMVNMVRHMQRERVAGVYTAPLPVAEHDEFAARESLLHRAYLGPYAKTYSMPSRELYERLDFAQRLQMSRFDNICSLLRRSVWAHIPFGHTTFGEDISWSKHVQAQGYHVIYDPFARVFHSHMRPPEYTRKRYATETFHVAAMLATFPVDYSDVGIDEMDRLSDAIEGDSAAFIARARALSLRHRLTVRNVRNARHPAYGDSLRPRRYAARLARNQVPLARLAR